MGYEGMPLRRMSAACLVAALLLAPCGATVAAGKAQGSKTSGGKHNGDWQTVYTNKDGKIKIHYPTPDPLSRVYLWQLRSTFNYPVRVDYTGQGFGRGGVGGQLYRTVFIPAHSQTRAFGIPSPVQPLVTVQQVRKQ